MKIKCTICNEYESISLSGIKGHFNRNHPDKINLIQDNIYYEYDDSEPTSDFICLKCNKQFNRKESLSKHFKLHGKIQTKREIICQICNKTISTNFYKKHLKNDHKLCKYDIFLIIGATRSKNYDLNYKLYKVLWDRNYRDIKIRYDISFDNYLKWFDFREFTNEDIINYVDNIIPYKKEHGSVYNSKELAQLMSTQQDDYKHIYQKMLESNPYYKHGGELSPWSKDFVGYSDLTEAERVAAVRKSTQQDRDDRNINQYKYWMNKGMSESEAKDKVKDVQSVGKLERFIERYGEIEGTKRWEDRQIKWQKTLKSKSPEERCRIAKAKMGNGKGWSKISQKLFWELYNILPSDIQKECVFATNNHGVRNDEIDNEYMVITNHGIRFIDFYIKELNLSIESDGGYWHGSASVKKLDAERDKQIIEVMPNLDIIRINESDYINNPKETIEYCVELINEKIRNIRI